MSPAPVSAATLRIPAQAALDAAETNEKDQEQCSPCPEFMKQEQTADLARTAPHTAWKIHLTSLLMTSFYMTDLPPTKNSEKAQPTKERVQE